MDLAQTVRKCVLKLLPHDRSDPRVVMALRAKRPGELIVLFLNWRERLVFPTPRQVLISRAFEQNPILYRKSVAVSQLITDIEHGRDLTKYLSRNVKIGFELPRKQGSKALRRLRYLDLLLNDWGIYHLHASTVIESDGFVERNKELIFAIFRPERAYLIDILSHEDFTEERLIQIVVDTWPNDHLVNEIKGVTGSRRRYTKEDRSKLRDVGITTFVEIGDRVFLPAAGISSAGTSTKASILSNRMLRALRRFEEEVKSNPGRIVEWIRCHGGNPPEVPHFEFTFLPDGFGVRETASRFAIRLPG
jgi:hypothetical protein